MSSLVAYEDSESEDESADKAEEGTSASVRTKSSEPNQASKCSTVSPNPHTFTPDPNWTLVEYCGKVLEPSLHQPPSQPQTIFGMETKSYSSRTALDEHLTSTKISPLQTLPNMAQTCSVLNPAKRPHTVPSGVQPYIPKRQRLATAAEIAERRYRAEQASGNQTDDSQILSDVSERVKPYLAHKPSRAAGIPRRLLMSLGGHHGPVNTVQWCPVPHLSHLLLSASMDKTFKVTIVTVILLLALG